VRWSAVLAEPRSTAPPRFTSRRRRFRPRAELATRPLTSPVTTLGGSASLPIPFRFGPPGPASPAVSSKTKGSAVPGRLPSTSAPSPEHARRLRALRVGSRGARHRCRCSRACGFRHRDPASGAPSPAEPGPRTRRGHECQRARPRICRNRDQTPLVDFCNQPNPRARPRDRPIPASCAKERSSRALARSARPALRHRLSHERAETLSRLRRRGAQSSSSAEASPTNRIPAPSTGSTVVAFGLRREAEAHQQRRLPAEVSRARGRRLALPAPPSLELPFDSRRRGCYPNPIRSDTSCRETVAPPAGEAGLCQARLASEPAR